MEKIICAAVYYDDNIEHPHQPKNIKTGIVVCGMRHHNCFATMSALSDGNKELRALQKDQGFITTKDRYVDRKEAYKIAKAAGQLIKEHIREKLTSEDLY